MLSVRTALQGLAIIVALPVSCSAIMNQIESRASFPPKMQQGLFFAQGVCNWFLSYQGAYAISLTDKTIDEIRREGLRFFSDINDSSSRAKSEYFQGEWKPTPIPDWFHSEGAVPNLDCGEKYSWFWPKGIVEALDRPGSYYLGKGGRSLYVIPDLGLLVASGNDR